MPRPRRRPQEGGQEATAQPEPQAKAQNEPRPKPQSRSRRKPQPKPDAQPKPQPDAQPKPQPDAQPKPQPRRKPQPGPQADAQPRAEGQREAQPRGDNQARPRSRRKPHPRQQFEGQQKPQGQGRPQPQPQPEAQAKPQAEGQPRPRADAQPRPRVKPQLKPKQKLKSRPQGRPQPEGQPRPEGQAGAQGDRRGDRRPARPERRPDRRGDRRPERFYPPRLPADGIKARTQRGEFGESWWARRWVDVLESFGYGSRLARGRIYARGGAVLSMEIARGQVTARVQGSRPSPYTVKITVPPLSDEQWSRAVEAMAEQAIFAAKLSAGEMPQEIEEAFSAAQVPLFPRSARDLATSCSCPDPANPCKHIAAVYYLLGERFDSDPFLLFELRGRTKEQIGAALRDLRARGVAELDEPAEPQLERAPALADQLAAFDDPAGLDEITPQIAPPELEAPLLRRYGPPPASTGEDLTAVYRTLSRLALERLLGE